MKKKSGAKAIVGFLKDADDLVHILTGTHIPNLVAKGVELFGIKPGEVPPTPELDFNNPYYVLGVRPDANDIVIRGAFRSLVKEFHPDTGTKPNAAKFQQANEAYNTIMRERNGDKTQS